MQGSPQLTGEGALVGPAAGSFLGLTSVIISEGGEKHWWVLAQGAVGYLLMCVGEKPGLVAAMKPKIRLRHVINSSRIINKPPI